jgi:hypothetical protein
MVIGFNGGHNAILSPHLKDALASSAVDAASRVKNFLISVLAL